MKYFTSDTHFGHANIIKYCDRPFSSPVEMDETLIRNWNNTVKPEDTIFHLGDFGFATEDRLKSILSRLNGIKYLILGNHDKTIRRSEDLRTYFVKCTEYLEIDEEKIKLILMHYPMLIWNKSHHGAFMLHGHSHGTCKYPFEGRIMDVGVDCHNYHPISFTEVRNKMLKKSVEVIDHHGN